MGRPLDLEDISALQLPSDPAIAPDGRRVVYVLRTTDTGADADRTALWSVTATDDGWAEPVQLTRGTADSSPAFSPTGDRVAFLRGGDGPPQLHLLAVSGGEAERVTDLPAGAGAPVWSPAGDRIAFTAAVRDADEDEHAPISTSRLGYKADGAGLLRSTRQHVHVLDLATGEVRQLTSGDWHAGRPAWSPDGEQLALAAGPEPDADTTWRTPAHLVPAAGGPLRRVAGQLDVAGPITWTADGAALLVAGQQRLAVGHAGLFVQPVEGGGDPVDLAAPLDRNVMPGGPGYPGGLPQLTADGGTVVFCVRDRGCSHVYATAVDGSSSPRPVLTGDDLVVSGLSVAADADRAAVVLADPGTYGEVAVVDLTDGTTTRVTRHTAAGLPDVDLLVPEPRTFTVHDGTEVHGWLLRDPAAPAPGPLLVDVHGGPHNAWAPAADAAHPYHQALAAAGWSVLLVNPRGSDGYGLEFFTGAAGRWGTADERDFLDPVDQLVAEGVADPDRLALTGYSYGGYLTCWLTGRTDRFAAAIAGGVVSDLTSMLGTSDAGYALGGMEWPDPWTAPAELAELSPISRVHQVRTPTLVLQGQADERCPVGQAEQWFAALRTRGVPTELVLYPGGSHLFILSGRPSHRVDYSRRLVRWAQQHVPTPRPAIDAAHWQQRLDVLAARHSVPGAALAVRRVGAGPDELVELATGVLNRSTGVATTTDSVFQIGSITKVWTTTLVMQLVDEGRLDLDAPLAEVLPELQLGDPDVAKRVTMRHLLTHTSGIAGDVFTDTGRGDDCVERYVAALADTPQNHPLGATFSYCNSGFTLAGRVVEVLTGQTWDAALRERVIEPLGLAHTSTLPEEAVLHRAAVGHIAPEPGADPAPVPVWVLPRSLGPAGLVNATAADVTAFGALHLRGGVTADGTRVLSAASTEAMQSRQAELPDRYSLGDSWGLGWIRHVWDGELLVGHDGGTYGQGAFLRVLPEHGLVIALLTNGGKMKDLYTDVMGELVGELAGLQLPAPLEPPEQAPQVELARYAGSYERSSVATEVFERDGGLVMRETMSGAVAEAVGQPVQEHPLVPVAEGLFAVRAPGTDGWSAVTFHSLPDGTEYLHTGGRANPRKSR
ncbi:serine hydrolase [Modestobacter versicolor]|uniref:Dipeptidyl aminopeptidase/acylaminoacyl peptidase/CubicO group peptidase (Beta-lactamase class C family) n=1 Tax=Modestobacter versicolor TaxID=429133 RepID=A0A323V8S1_9ACTN|nr:serine hydrolase [Modestobacter versicolor]MBB3678271.1 dipeptidyl aminopeptidase/acylaminoacyl peptidase/CubicO group peptidase (beta-lactamase class C family) [Modestobacter versicolor]PZA21192.1 serine hydrolase [Modestobacter versicolor]